MGKHERRKTVVRDDRRGVESGEGKNTKNPSEALP